jgi:hypothetical protein
VGFGLEVDTGNLSCDFGGRCRVRDRVDMLGGNRVGLRVVSRL